MTRGLKTMSVVTAVVMFFVLLAGALVTNTGSADGCGASWPLCKGTFMPDWDYEAIIEASHRGISTLIGLLSIGLAVWVWRAAPRWKWLGVGTLLMVCLQGALGAMAVVWPQPKAVLAAHMGVSLLCFTGSVVVATLITRGDAVGPAPSPTFRRWVWTVAVYGYGVVYLGAYVRHMKASAACLGWPLCNGDVVPPLFGLTAINFIHRLAAAFLTLMIIRMAFMARRERPDLRRAAWLAVVLVVAQVLAGALFGLGYINLATQQLHTALITLLWGTLSYLCLRVQPAGQAATPPALAGKPTGLAH
ncbi:MAG TPA: COX15/CtaA family protein [Symbiobacteriaceae bacterium]|nr:COX15/CtaA family protein [Symbiobacteriaceae bacterium]